MKLHLFPLSYLIAAIIFLLNITSYATVQSVESAQLTAKFSMEDNNISEPIFRQTLKKIEDAFQPYARQHGILLLIDGKWNNNEPNASTIHKESQWLVNIFGGLARHPLMNIDALTIATCHELGHHFAGYPFFTYAKIKWGAVEGQADYFASHTCARLLWQNDFDKNAQYREIVNSVAKEQCDQAWPDIKQQNLCYRIAEA